MVRWLLALAAICAARPLRAEPTADVLARQVAALADPSALLVTLAPDALIFGNGSFTLPRGRDANAIVASLAASASRLPALTAEATPLATGGTANVRWLAADLVIAHKLQATRYGVARDLTQARVIELVVADGASWNVVALAFASTGPSTAGPAALGDALGPPGDGPLTALVASPSRLDAALRDSAATIVDIDGRDLRPAGSTSEGRCGSIDDGELAIGTADAHRALAAWRARDAKVTGAIEVHGRGWGWVAADVTLGASPLRMLVLAVPDAAGRWQVVAIVARTRLER